MWKTIFYKEWLKIRWFLMAFTVIEIAATGYIFLALKHNLAFTGPRNIWSMILFQEYQFYKILKYIPLTGAVLVALAQYLPEVSGKRLKLTFHLPVDENTSLLVMQAFGTFSLFVAFAILSGLFTALSLIYFPVQLVTGSLITMFPWLLAGFLAYFWVSVIVLEPDWFSRFCYLLIGAALLAICFIPAGTATYGPENRGLGILIFLLGAALLYPGYRFRKGGF
jgi:hypothetical protein